MEKLQEKIFDNATQINVQKVLALIWQGKKLIISITTVFAFISVIYALSIPNEYRATTVLAPAQDQSGGLTGVLGQLGGIASLAGVNIGPGKSSESQIAQEVMKSWSFIENFILNNNLAKDIYAAKRWDASSNQLIYDADVFDTNKNQWLIESEITGYRSPTSWELYETFRDRLTVSEDRKTSLVTVSIEYFSPEVAKEWLDMYVQSINSYMQMRQVTKVSSNIEYLQAEIEKTAIAEMQEVFYTIIEEQTKAKMLAQASPDYAFVAVSPSMIPEKKSKPKRALICILGTLLGAFLSLAWIFGSYSIIRE